MCKYGNERILSQKVSAAKKWFIGEAEIAATDIDVDYKKGIVWVHDHRVAQLHSSGKVMVGIQEAFDTLKISKNISDFQAQVNAAP